MYIMYSCNLKQTNKSYLFFQGKIYVIGGFGISKAILNSQECYDPDTDKWTKLTSMKKMCGFVGGTLVDRPVHFEDRPSLNQSKTKYVLKKKCGRTLKKIISWEKEKFFP